MRIKPKKSLGQNFLVDKNIQRKIAQACAFRNSDRVLEIGAGRGELTRLIAVQAKRVYAIEIDARLAGLIRDNLKDYPNVKIIKEDILRLDLKKYVSGAKGKLKVVGNIPYYITTPIIERLFRYRDKIEAIYISVQKEFGRRIASSPGIRESGAFSYFVHYYAQPEILFSIKKTCFMPIPGVDSVFLRLTIRKKPAVSVKDERLFFKIIRAAFQKRRKTLRNSLAGLIKRQGLDYFFDRYHIDKNTRPERLTLADFAGLTASALTASGARNGSPYNL